MISVSCLQNGDLRCWISNEVILIVACTTVDRQATIAKQMKAIVAAVAIDCRHLVRALERDHVIARPSVAIDDSSRSADTANDQRIITQPTQELDRAVPAADTVERIRTIATIEL